MSTWKNRTAEKVPDRGKRRAIIATACFVVRGRAAHDLSGAGRWNAAVTATGKGEEGTAVRSCDHTSNK
jgi:hypothetical protein